jgi:hypothetical protein
MRPRASTKTGDKEKAAAARLQIPAILCLVLMLSVILHKGLTDIAALAQKHPGQDFWRALGRYLIANLAGG